MARNPSHLGSNKKLPSCGRVASSLASIGSIGGAMANALTDPSPASPEPLDGSLVCLAPLLFPIAWWSTGVERVDQALRGGGDLVDRSIERGFVHARRLRDAAQLAHELEGRGADLVIRGRRFKVGERLDITAHACAPSMREPEAQNLALAAGAGLTAAVQNTVQLRPHPGLPMHVRPDLRPVPPARDHAGGCRRGSAVGRIARAAPRVRG